MSYLGYINNFWQKDLEFSFSADEVNLYFRLLKHANALNWKPRFNLSVDKLMAEVGMRTKKPFDTARKTLREAGLLDFKNGNGRGCTTEYQLLGADSSERVPERGMKNAPLSGTLSGTLSGEVSGLLHKKKIKKSSKADAVPHTPSLDSASVDNPPQPAASRKRPPARADEVAALELPHPGPEFAQLWAEFRAMPKQVKKPVTALRRLLATLGKYAEGFACLMLDKAIQGAWSGVEFDGTATAYAAWQAEQARKSIPTPAPVIDPAALFGHTQTAAEGLAKARKDPDYQRYLAEEAARQAQQAKPADGQSDAPANSGQPAP